MVTHLEATERHLPYEITQCYVSPDTGKPQPNKLALDLPIPEGWKAELTLVLVIYRCGLHVCRQSLIKVVTHDLLIVSLIFSRPYWYSTVALMV